MRSSRVLAKMRSGKTAVCMKVNLSDPRVVELAGIAGFDCVWIDMEHVPNDWSNVENQIRAAKIYDMDTVVRVSKGSYSDLIKPLEADAAGIMYPHLMSLEEAKKVIYNTKFHPVGRRPLDGGNIDGKFGQLDLKGYIRVANKERFIIVQIEDPEPLKELEEIIKLDGIDMIFFGPGDFSQGIKVPGEFDNPQVIKTRNIIAELCKKHNRFAGTVGSLENLNELSSIGYTFVSIGADVLGLGKYMNELYESTRAILKL